MVSAAEKLFANLLIASRWLMAPLYLGLTAALIVVIVEFFQEIAGIVTGFSSLHRDGVILAALKLIDLVLIARLVLIVIGAGLDTIVSPRVTDAHPDRPAWMGKDDFSGLKLKVVASIIAIAAVDLLEGFIEIETMDKSDILWKIAVFLAFVVAGLLLAWMDRLSAETH
ncbi:MAG TPA: YqhA family protein [Stellaceae bacterium]|jgi:uncharacterized protein (TIGR00645 family)|nr:YqhA family protein [Stellaceae bacterium]